MAGQDWPSFADTPIFQSFFEEHDAYERYHIHLVGVRPKNHTTSTGTGTCTTSGGIGDRQNMFGGTAIFDTLPDPYVLVETIGPDTGSNTDYFPIGVHTFPVLTNSPMPVWDAKCTLIAKKGSTSTTEGIRIRMLDHNPAASMRDDELLAEIVLERCELPDAKDINSDDDGWQEYVKTADTTGRMKDLEILFSIKVTDCASRVISKEETEALYHQETDDANSRTYLEQIIVDPSGKPEDNALLQCWRQPSSKKAVLWVLVRSIKEQRIH
jgi:hypothetical protein